MAAMRARSRSWAGAVGASPPSIGRFERLLPDLGIELFLAAEVVVDSRDIGVGVPADLENGGVVEPLSGENLQCRLK